MRDLALEPQAICFSHQRAKIFFQRLVWLWRMTLLQRYDAQRRAAKHAHDRKAREAEKAAAAENKRQAELRQYSSLMKVSLCRRLNASLYDHELSQGA